MKQASVRLSVLLLILCVALLCAFPAAAQAVTSYDLSNGPLVIAAGSGDYRITGSYTGATSAVTVSDNYFGQITLSGVNIQTTATPPPWSKYPSAIALGNNVELCLDLIGNNTIRSEGTGIEVTTGSSLTISEDGSLDVRAGYGSAGIGSNNGGKDAGTIIVEGGNIAAYGGGLAAGIGGGYGTSATYIRISGGTVYAEACVDAAGIGGGPYGNSGIIIIDGGFVEATGGTGIGNGIFNLSRSPSSITIRGNAKVVARGLPDPIYSHAIGHFYREYDLIKVSIEDYADVTVYNSIGCDVFEMDKTATLTGFSSSNTYRPLVTSKQTVLDDDVFFIIGASVKDSGVINPLSTTQTAFTLLVDSVTGLAIDEDFSIPAGVRHFARSVTTDNPVWAFPKIGNYSQRQLSNYDTASLTMIPTKTFNAFERVILVTPKPVSYTVEYYVGATDGSGYKLGSAFIPNQTIASMVTLKNGAEYGELNYMRPANEYSEGVQQGAVPRILGVGDTTIKVLYSKL